VNLKLQTVGLLAELHNTVKLQTVGLLAELHNTVKLQSARRGRY